MKTNELMIGDWVHVEAHRRFNAQNVKVETIPDNDSDNEHGHHYGHIGAWLEGGDNDFRDVETRHLQSIPLTKEILEKNGFKLHAISEIYELVSPKKDWFVAIGFKDGCIDWCKVHRWGDEYLGSIKYVHELQRALRLLKINKDIAL